MTEPDHHAPEGAFCAEHQDRPAAFTCPRCGNYACIFCWHALATRCEACLKRDPAAAAPPIPWESGQGSWPARWLSTLLSAFRPVLTAPAFAQSDLSAALRFFLCSALPLAALAGVIPETKTLMFGNLFSVTVQHNASPGVIALDVALAMLAQIAWFALDFLTLYLPYSSLVRAYAPEPHRAAATRVLLYRFWLSPAALLIFFVALWALPGPVTADATPPLVEVVFFMRFFLSALLFVAMRATARLACGIGPVLSYVVVVVPFLVWNLAQPLIARGFALLGLGG